MCNLYQRLHKYLQHCFIVMNSEPNKDDSIECCFLLHQYMGAQFKYTINPIYDRQVTVLEAWLASTFAHWTKPMPLGSSIFGGNTSMPSRWPNSLDVQSHHSNSDSSTTGSLRSKTISALWWLFRYPNIWSTCSKWPSLSNMRCDDIFNILKQISMHPNSTIHLKIPIKDW